MSEPSKEAADAATWIVDGFLDDGCRYKPEDYREDHAKISEAIGRHFADVIRKAAAMDALDRIIRIKVGTDTREVTVFLNACGSITASSALDEEIEFDPPCVGPTVAAAIESLAAKIGA